MPRLPLLSLVALALVVSGCGSSHSSQPLSSAPVHQRQHDGDAGSTPRTPSTSPATPSADATETAPPAKTHAPRHRQRVPVPAPGRASARRAPLETHLLAAERVPALTARTDGGGWTVTSTGPEDSVSVGACQETALETIGAVSAVRRTYAPSDDSRGSAVQVVARFADDKSAWRAHEVLRSWHEACETEVGPLRTVTVDSGTGENYRVRYAASQARRARVAAFGIVANGPYLCVVEIKAVRGDFPADRAPARSAVRRIARSFT
ncbi:hypothetical protein GCM10009844_15400 [Nocardioides koreensis]|uniref:PknH-like extracellular domain-containing protein n=1 Tax=Nocardioides koreensis TaxID=433651 RepID=A0ABN2ZJU7_9ACTN